MGLGRREARHQSVAASKVAVDSTQWWDFKPGQAVMTVDGFPGVVTAVQDGPYAGSEAYEVTLDNGMGGGLYTSGQLTVKADTTASMENTAAADYPELGEILVDRPDIAPNTVLASRVAHLTPGEEHDSWDHEDEQDPLPEMPHPSDGHCDICESGAHSTTDHVDEPDESDAFITHDRNGKWQTTFDSKHLGGHDDYPSAEHAIHHAMDDHGYYPNIWIDRGHGGGHDLAPSDVHERFNSHFPQSGADGKHPLPAAEAIHPHKEPMDEYTPEDKIFHHLKHDHDVPDDAIATLRRWGAPHHDHDEMHAETRCHRGGCNWTAAGHEHHERNIEDVGNVGSQIDAIMGDNPHMKNLLDSNPHGPSKFSSVMPAPDAPTEQPQAKWATCKDCGFSHANAAVGSECLLCGGQMSRHPDKYAALIESPYRMLVVAATDDDFRFHITATWSDVRAKAKRLRSEGNVNVIAVGDNTIAANVKGEHHVYETEIQRVPGQGSIAMWHCGCKWAAYSWGRSGRWKRYEGRMCSHAYALQLEAQSRGMFGNTVTEDQKAPQWLRPRTRVVTEYDRDDQKNVSRPAQPRKRDVNRSYRASLIEVEASPVTALVTEAMETGVEPAEIVLSLTAAGIDGQAWFHEASGETQPCKHCGHAEDLHKNDHGKCGAPGCDCGGFSKEAKDKRHHHKHHGHPHAYGPAWGYGAGFLGLCSQCAGGGCGHCQGTGQADASGGAGDAGTGSTGGGDAGGGMSAGAAKTATPVWTPQMEGEQPGEDPMLDHPAVMNPGGEGVHRPVENPASAGWASGEDPANWGQQSPFGRMSALMDESMFEPDAMTALADLESVAEFHPEPEAALPETDGSPGGDEGDDTPNPVTHEDMTSEGAISPPREDAERDLLLAQSQDQILAAFQRNASHLQGGGGGTDSSDIAGAAREALAKMSMKTFSPGEQAQIISEGADVVASNLDRLDISGTHYEALEANLASLDDEDEGWMS